MGFYLHMLKKRLSALTGRLADVGLFVGAVLLLGLGSSLYMIEQGSRLTTESHGPWMMWTAAARTDADPYTRAHFARAGILPLSTDSAELHLAVTDSDGDNLHSSCDYVIEGQTLTSHWWSVTVFNDEGRLIPNAVERHAFTADTIALQPDGTYRINLARDARPGNWLPTSGAGRFAVAATLVDYGTAAVAASPEERQKMLPAIRKITCR